MIENEGVLPRCLRDCHKYKKPRYIQTAEILFSTLRNFDRLKTSILALALGGVLNAVRLKKKNFVVYGWLAESG